MDFVIGLCYVYSFLIGICVASFINVVIWRVPQNISIAKGRSFCPNCQHALSAKDLFPIFSYVLLKGKCRYCKSKIPMRDTLLELLGGLLGMYSFYLYGFQWESLVVFILFMIFLAITMIDFDTLTIPNGLLIALCFPVVAMVLLQPEISLLERGIGIFIIALPMYLLIVAIPDCFGGGDVKLIAIGGFLLGWKLTLFAAFVAILVAGCYAIYLLLSKKVKKGAHIAFGPYLCFGIMVSLLYGNMIITSYLNLFGL